LAARFVVAAVGQLFEHQAIRTLARPSGFGKRRTSRKYRPTLTAFDPGSILQFAVGL